MVERLTSAPQGPPPLPPGEWDPRVREAVRLLETEVPPPATKDLGPRVGLTAFHFARLFTAQVGASPQVWARAWLMRHVMGRLRYTDDPITDVAHDFGFKRLNAFSRAFSEHVGISAFAWRRAAKAELAADAAAGRTGPVRVELFKPQPLFARRYLGPRAESGAQWADFLARLPPDLLRCTRMGLLYDDPRSCPPEAIRYDCAVQVRAGAVLPPALAEQGFERIVAPGGEWACSPATDRAGVSLAYRRILAEWLPTRPDRTLEGDPHLERFRITPEDSAREPVLAVCLRVRPLNAIARPGLADDPAVDARPSAPSAEPPPPTPGPTGAVRRRGRPTKAEAAARAALAAAASPTPPSSRPNTTIRPAKTTNRRAVRP